jgi:predicted amidohydrolase
MKATVGLAQILVQGGEAAANLERARENIRQAADRGCDVVVLPECLDVGWTHPSARELAQPLPGPHSDVICCAASDAGLFVVAGLTERAGDRIYNAAILVSPAGEILLRHRKINELDIAHDLYSTGDSLAVAATPLGVLGVTICADNFPSSLALGHSVARMGCRLLLSPSAWAVDADHDNERQPYGALWLESYTTLARLYDMAVVGVSNVGWLSAGPWRGRKCIGCSLAIAPGGRVAARGPYGEDAEALLFAELEIPPAPARGTGFAGVLADRGYSGP